MASLVSETILVRVMSSTSEHGVGTVITAGDFNAYTLEIEFMDVDVIDGSCTLRFVTGAGVVTDVPATVSGNKVSCVLDDNLYAVPGLTCWVRFYNTTERLLTPLRIYFSNIRLTPAAPIAPE